MAFNISPQELLNHNLVDQWLYCRVALDEVAPIPADAGAIFESIEQSSHRHLPGFEPLTICLPIRKRSQNFLESLAAVKICLVFWLTSPNVWSETRAKFLQLSTSSP